jgi:hypothetical protein
MLKKHGDKMSGKTKKTQSQNYYDWLKMKRKDSIKAQEQKEKFMQDLKELSCI